MAEPRAALRQVSKSFGGYYAVRNVDLELFPGEVHALLGENGAGKSTIVKILGGIHRPDSGTLEINGIAEHISSPAVARRAGISLVHQELSLFPDLDVAENIYIGHFPKKGKYRLHWESMYESASARISELGLDIDVRTKVRFLSVAQRQVVEIVKALSFDAGVLVLDEPTAALSAGEVRDFFHIVRTLRDRGVAVLFVSHRLEEIEELADRVTVLRDGELVITTEAHRLSKTDLVRHMVGRQLTELFPKAHAEIGDSVLEVSGLTKDGSFTDISFDLRRGEILGVCGLIGAGRSEIAQAIFGIDRPDAGTVVLDGNRVDIRHPGIAMRHGLGYVPEDRHLQGLMLEWSVAKNASLTTLKRLSRLGMLSRTKERALASLYVSEMDVRCSGVDQLVQYLSGGNQQKVVISKWLATEPRILILDEPTRGVDIGTKAEVHRLISGLAAQGLAIMLISSELPEILAMSDRILVIHEGRCAGVFEASRATQESLMSAATGEVVSV